MYAIRNLCHRTDISMGVHGFSIDLHPDFEKMVEKSEITQTGINHLLTNEGRIWLDRTGFGGYYDPDNYGLDRDPEKPLGPNAEKSYQPVRDLRVSWGIWGPEHISVPGNACGLDIERRSFGSIWKGGVQLLPHNVDSLLQKYLLLITFTEIAESVLLLGREKP